MTEEYSNDASAYRRHAEEFVVAVETLAESTFNGSGTVAFIMAPVLHNLGVASELVFKTLLLEGGYSQKEIRKFGHCLVDLYLEAATGFDQMKFENLIEKEARKHHTIPEQLAAAPRIDERIYFCFPNQLATLEANYRQDTETGHGFRTRYPSRSKRKKFRKPVSSISD